MDNSKIDLVGTAVPTPGVAAREHPHMQACQMCVLAEHGHIVDLLPGALFGLALGLF